MGILLMMQIIERLAETFSDRGYTLSLAESCTGGSAGSLITERAGASSFFLGSAVTYSNESKTAILGVSEDTLRAYGAVSQQTASEMAEGARRAYGADVAASVTGIAGPDGGSSEKPVGTVWMAVTDGHRTVAYGNHFSGSRSQIREQSVRVLMENIISFLEDGR